MWTFLDLLEPSFLPKYYRTGPKGGRTERTKVLVTRDTYAFTVCQCRVCISPLKILDYALCCLSRGGQWRCRFGAPFPLQTRFASWMKYSSYLWVLDLFCLFVCFFVWSSAIPCRITLLSFQISKSYPASRALAVATWLSFLPWIQSVHETSPGGSS